MKLKLEKAAKMAATAQNKIKTGLARKKTILKTLLVVLGVDTINV